MHGGERGHRGIGHPAFVPLVLLLLTLLAPSAAAQTAIYYAARDNGYGWCDEYLFVYARDSGGRQPRKENR